MSNFIPVPLQTWAVANEPGENMLYRGGYWPQIMFVRDQLPQLICGSYDEFKAISEGIRVIDTHGSKSIDLPVMEISHPSGAKFVLRYNFHVWAISVELPQPLVANFHNLFAADEKVHAIYCGGFPENRVYPPYSENHQNFTLELSNEFEVYCFFLILGDTLGFSKDK